ncbi:MAG: modB1 [Verrucomicrobiaceae bacterium]|nr:modB1 [Verrucomicrobiaceae bacterium]
MNVASIDWQPIWLTLRLASITTVVLMVAAIPLGWWLARTHSWMKQPLSAVFALPLVLPPTVLGFYLLLLLGPHGPVGGLTLSLGLGTLPFTFTGLVIASSLYSLPFALQPIQNAFENIGSRPFEVAATLRATRWDRAVSIALPLARNGLLSAAVLAFAHTIGEFGVVLMIGGNIPGATKVLSVAIYDHVESMEYAQAHWLAGGMLAFSFITLLTLYIVSGRSMRIVR